MIAKSDAGIAIIKETLNSICKQLDQNPKGRLNNEAKSCALKMYNLLFEENRAIERFYFIYLTCELSIGSKQNKIDKLLRAILPTPQTAQSLSLISDLSSFALCQSSIYSGILDNLSAYLNVSDIITISVENWNQADSLAIDSPSFCSALMSRADLTKLSIDKKLLAKWLQDLSRVEQDFPPPSLNQLLRYSLFHRPAQKLDKEELHKSELAESDFHLGILTLIQSRKCQTLTNQFLMDVVSTLAQQISDSSDKTKTNNSTDNSRLLVDRFAQILSVAAASKVTTITNALRNSLSRLDSNQLIASVIQRQNK